MKGLRARISRGVAIGNKYLLGQSGAGSGRNVVQVISVADPGAVKTNIMRELPQCLSLLAYSVLKLLGILQLPDEGVSSILDAALAPPETSGMYFFGGKGRTIESSSISYNPILANRLWLTSCDIFIELEHMYEKTTTLPSS